jgi:hypothetical protein
VKRANGDGVAAIHKWLNNNIMPICCYFAKIGVVSEKMARGNGNWGKTQIYAILKNRVYAGNMVQDKGSTQSYNLTHIGKSEWVVTPNTHEPLVSREVFEQVQKLFSKEKAPKNPSNSENIFLRKLFCGHRGYTMARVPTGKSLDYNIAADQQHAQCGRMAKGERKKANVVYGYRKNGDCDLEIDETPAATVREIFGLAAKGVSTKEIAAAMSQKQLPNPGEMLKLSRGHEFAPTCKWTAKSVNSILQNVQYTGSYVSGKILKDYATGRKYHTPENQWIVLPDMQPAIVSTELFDEVQKVRKQQNFRRQNCKPQDYLLRGGIIKCGCCGYAMSYDNISDPVYRCHHTAGTPDAECHMLKVSVREVDELVLAIIRKKSEALLNCADLSKLRRKTGGEQKIGDCEGEIAQNMEERQRQYELFALGEISRDEFMKLNSESNSQLSRLNQQLVAMKAELEARRITAKSVAVAKTVLDNSLDNRGLIETLIETVKLYPDKRIDICWKIADFASV